MDPLLEPLPSAFASTVATLHRVAEEVVSPARTDGHIWLQATPGGFGTPVFQFDGADHQVRVEGVELVRRAGEDERRSPLEVDPISSQALAAWYALGDRVLARLIAGAGPDDAPSPIRLWPEHFDIAIELGSEAAGARANYGFSPGDEVHDEPYAYVGPWSAPVAGELWTASGFPGAELTHAELRRAADPGAAALEFFTTRAGALAETARSSR